MLINNIHLTELNSPKQTIKARVELYKGSTLEKVCNCGEVLGGFTIERTGENKFFGFGICQKIHGTLMDIDRSLSLTKQHTIEASFGVNSDFTYPFPKFYVQEVNRDEVSNEISFSAYDILYKAEEYTVNDLNLERNYTIEVIAAACANILNVPMRIIGVNDNSFDTDYPNGANLTGEESVRRILDAIAEATQTIYYINSKWELVFRRLDRAGNPVVEISKDFYVDLGNQEVRTLRNLMHVTELEDNVASEGTVEGVTQFIRNNPFWELREDLGTLLDNAQAAVGGMSIAQFESNWSGNYLIEIGDKIAFAADNGPITSYLLDDTITFDGVLMQYSKWAFNNNEGERASNPTSLGDALNQTFAKVDKVNNEITLQASKIDGNTSEIAAIKINTDSISATVTEIEKNAKVSSEYIDGEIADIKKELNVKATAEDLTIAIKKEISNGVNKVETTENKFTFDDKGLNISKTGSPTNTQITENGMVISKEVNGISKEVLTVNASGVNAENLHATTYLKIGVNSRFEDYNNKTRTGCFWIGN